MTRSRVNKKIAADRALQNILLDNNKRNNYYIISLTIIENIAIFVSFVFLFTEKIPRTKWLLSADKKDILKLTIACTILFSILKFPSYL